MENMDKELTVCTKMGADSPAKCFKKFQSKMSAQAQKFKIFWKKLSLGVRSPWF